MKCDAELVLKVLRAAFFLCCYAQILSLLKDRSDEDLVLSEENVHQEARS